MGAFYPDPLPRNTDLSTNPNLRDFLREIHSSRTAFRILEEKVKKISPPRMRPRICVPLSWINLTAVMSG